jgi:hypothetical protein
MNIDPREFERQERALCEDADWRAVAQALRRSPGEPPTDFAASMAAMVQGAAEAPATATLGAAAAGGSEGRVERWLLRALVVVLGATGLGVLAVYGRAWLGSMATGFDAIAPALGGATAFNWMLAAAACVALSWAFARGASPARR